MGRWAPGRPLGRLLRTSLGALFIEYDSWTGSGRLDASGGFPSQHFYFCSRFVWMVIYRCFNRPKRDQSYLDSDTDAGVYSVLRLESRRAYQIGSLHPPLFDLLLKVWFPIQVANP